MRLRRVAEQLRPKPSSTTSSASCSDGSVSSTEAIDAAVWQTVAAAVAANDRDAMAATYHPDAVLVSTTGTIAVQQQLVTWGVGMEKIRHENRQASVEFRFATRHDGEKTAFETGMFRYAETDANGVEQPVFVPMEALLVRKVRKQSGLLCCWGCLLHDLHEPAAGRTVADAYGAAAGARRRGGVGRTGTVNKLHSPIGYGHSTLNVTTHLMGQ